MKSHTCYVCFSLETHTKTREAPFLKVNCRITGVVCLLSLFLAEQLGKLCYLFTRCQDPF